MAPSPDPLTNPYAPPASELAEAGDSRRRSRSYEGERRSVLLMILLSIVTLGAYPAFWYLRRTSFFDSLSSDKKLGGLQWAYLAMYVTVFIVALVPAVREMLRVVQLVGGIVNLVVAFRVAHILRSDFARTGRFIGVSGAGVFFFGCLYLQHVMNEAAATPARSAPTPP
jgi:hypothetical protein